MFSLNLNYGLTFRHGSEVTLVPSSVGTKVALKFSWILHWLVSTEANHEKQHQWREYSSCCSLHWLSLYLVLVLKLREWEKQRLQTDFFLYHSQADHLLDELVREGGSALGLALEICMWLRWLTQAFVTESGLGGLKALFMVMAHV